MMEMCLRTHSGNNTYLPGWLDELQVGPVLRGKGTPCTGLIT